MLNYQRVIVKNMLPFEGALPYHESYLQLKLLLAKG